MTWRAEFWYLFGIAALLIIINRLAQTRRQAWQNPAAAAFTLGVFSCTFGVLAKQPFLAQTIDHYLGPNTAWLAADSFFLLGLTGLTYWIDRIAAPTPAGRAGRPYRRSLALLAVVGWMVAAARLAGPTWAGLERGGIDVAGQPLLLSARLAYLGYDLWALLYLSRRFHHLRQHLTERISYLRLTLAWAAVSLAAVAPLLQAVATAAVFIQPALLPTLWPPVWSVVTALQVVVASLVLTLFFRPAYRLLSWLDKQYLIWQLRRLLAAINDQNPNLLSQAARPTPPSLPIREPDRDLAGLVNQLEIAIRLLGASSREFAPPAGRAMPAETRRHLTDQQRRLQQALTGGRPLDIPTASGETYALARWYAHFSRVIRPTLAGQRERRGIG